MIDFCFTGVFISFYYWYFSFTVFPIILISYYYFSFFLHNKWKNENEVLLQNPGFIQKEESPRTDPWGTPWSTTTELENSKQRDFQSFGFGLINLKISEIQKWVCKVSVKSICYLKKHFIASIHVKSFCYCTNSSCYFVTAWSVFQKSPPGATGHCAIVHNWRIYKGTKEEEKILHMLQNWWMEFNPLTSESVLPPLQSAQPSNSSTPLILIMPSAPDKHLTMQPLFLKPLNPSTLNINFLFL